MTGQRCFDAQYLHFYIELHVKTCLGESRRSQSVSGQPLISLSGFHLRPQLGEYANDLGRTDRGLQVILSIHVRVFRSDYHPHLRQCSRPKC